MNNHNTVWDLPTRLFHWLLVFAIILLWLSGEIGGLDINLQLPGGHHIYYANMDVHATLGQFVLVLLIFRIGWGMVGSTTARFRAFVRGPRAVISETRALLRGETPESFGHNPLGALMIVAMLALLLAQAATGLFAQDDLFFSGPLADSIDSETSEVLTGLHHQLFGAIQILIGIHILAILYYWLRGKNLIAAMVTGRYRSIETEAPAVKIASSWRALIVLGVAIAILLGILNI